MDKKLFRSLLLLITFTVLLILVIVKFDVLWGAVASVLTVCRPLFIGLAIAFVLTKPCAFFRCHLDRLLAGTALKKAVIPLAVTLSYLLLFGVVAAVFSFVLPQLVGSIGRFASNLEGYVGQAQVWINDLTAWLHLEELDLSRLDQVLRDLFNSALAALSNAVPQLVSLTSNLVSIVVTGVLALVFSIYMLSGKDRLLAQCRRVLRAYTPPKVCRMVLEVTAGHLQQIRHRPDHRGLHPGRTHLRGHGPPAAGLPPSDRRAHRRVRPGAHCGRLCGGLHLRPAAGHD